MSLDQQRIGRGRPRDLFILEITDIGAALRANITYKIRRFITEADARLLADGLAARGISSLIICESTLRTVIARREVRK